MDYHRRTIRLKNFDYAQNGFYFVTICVQMHANLFWKNQNRTDNHLKIMTDIEFNPDTGNKNRADTGVRPYIDNLNEIGQMMYQAWLDLPKFYPGVEIDEFVIMPNHLHGIIILKNVGVDPRVDPDNKTLFVDPNKKCDSLGIIIKKFKTLITKKYIDNVRDKKWIGFNKRLLQRNYYERIIRNETEYLKIREYIKNNPKMWKMDKLFVL